MANQRRAALAYLDSIAPLYPGGIPRRDLQEALTVAAAPRVRVVFAAQAPAERTVQGFEGAEGELIAAAVTKGMKLPREAAVLLLISEEDLGEGNAAELAEKAAGRDAIVVAMGERVAEAFAAAPFKVRRTAEIARVLSDGGAKRKFWEDLKALLEELGSSKK